MLIPLLTVFIFLVLSGDAYAWGLATHIELAETLLSNASLLAGACAAILFRNGKDFLLGNILADVIVAKKISPRRQKSHHWDAGLRLLQNSNSEKEHAFAYGFLSHLAADTVAHNDFVPTQIKLAGSTVSLGHLYWELRADYLSTSSHSEIKKLLKGRCILHEKSLEDHIYPALRNFEFNRTIFTNVNLWAHSRKFGRAMKLCHEVSCRNLSRNELDEYKSRSLERMVDVIINGAESKILHEDPNGKLILDNIKLQRRKKRSDILVS